MVTSGRYVNGTAGMRLAGPATAMPAVSRTKSHCGIRLVVVHNEKADRPVTVCFFCLSLRRV